MSSQLEHDFIAPTLIEHGSLFTTAIRLTKFDPRLGGYYKDENGDFQYQAAYGPTFNGELCAYLIFSGGIRKLKMLCGYNNGSGLEWKPVQSNRSIRIPYLDIRTNDIYDNRYLQNCMPPWVCE